MSDLETMVSMLTRAEVGYELYDSRTPRSQRDKDDLAEDLIREYASSGATIALLIMPGYQSHTEMVFNSDEQLVAMGSLTEL